jgi:hypothetical protein
VPSSKIAQLFLLPSGEKAVTRIVSFKPFCSREYHPVGAPEVTDSTFERELCEWLSQQIPAILSMPGNSLADRVQMYLMEFTDKVEEVQHETYLFIKSEKVTHYVSSIYLGAAEYSVTGSTRSVVTVGGGVKGEVGTQDIGGAAAQGAKVTKEKTNMTCKDCRIGDIDIVERRKGEAVVGYEILPVYTLVCHESMKKIVQNAIKFYLERESKFQ